MANMTSYSPASENAKPQESPVGSNPSNNAPAKPKSKPRKRVNTAEKRNQHNAIERARRETLNGKFISLARLLPSLAAVRRPSKSAIVNGSIAHLTHQRNQRLLAARLLRSLSAEREALIKECNEWRFANGLPARDDSTAWTDEVEEVCNVEKEQFGTFASMFDGDGDNDGEGGMDDMEEEGTAQPGEMTIEQAAAIAAQASFGPGGLLTPRSSTDMSSLLSSSWAQSMTHNNNNASFVPQTASSLPFNAFMNDSSTDSPASNSGSGFMPTPSTSAHAFLGGLPPVHQTPSPASSQSFDEAPKSSFTEQQLLFLRAIQQQQHMQQRQNLSMQQLQQLIQGYPLGMGFGNGNGNNGAALNNANGNSFASLLGGMNDSTGSDSPFAFFNSVNMQQGQTQFNQAMFAHSLGNGSGSSANVNVPAPPTLSRAQTENLEAWRKMSAMPNNLRNTLPMSMTFDQLQQARNSMDGF